MAASPAGYNAYPTQVDMNEAGDAAVVWLEGRQGFAVEGAVGP